MSESDDLNYPVSEAIEDAQGFTRGTTLYRGIRGWRPCMLVLLDTIQAHAEAANVKDARIAELEKALREIAAFEVGDLRGLEDEIAIYRIATRALMER